MLMARVGCAKRPKVRQFTLASAPAARSRQVKSNRPADPGTHGVMLAGADWAETLAGVAASNARTW